MWPILRGSPQEAASTSEPVNVYHLQGLKRCDSIDVVAASVRMTMADEDLFEKLPEQKRLQPEDRGVPRLRVPERNQIDTHWAALDDLIADDHPVRAVWAFVVGLDLSTLHDAIKAREGQPGHPPAAPQLMMALWLWATIDGVGSARRLRSLLFR